MPLFRVIAIITAIFTIGIYCLIDVAFQQKFHDLLLLVPLAVLGYLAVYEFVNNTYDAKLERVLKNRETLNIEITPKGLFKNTLLEKVQVLLTLAHCSVTRMSEMFYESFKKGFLIKNKSENAITKAKDVKSLLDDSCEFIHSILSSFEDIYWSAKNINELSIKNNEKAINITNTASIIDEYLELSIIRINKVQKSLDHLKNISSNLEIQNDSVKNSVDSLESFTTKVEEISKSLTIIANKLKTESTTSQSSLNRITEEIEQLSNDSQNLIEEAKQEIVVVKNNYRTINDLSIVTMSSLYENESVYSLLIKYFESISQQVLIIRDISDKITANLNTSFNTSDETLTTVSLISKSIHNLSLQLMQIYTKADELILEQKELKKIALPLIESINDFRCIEKVYFFHQRQNDVTLITKNLEKAIKNNNLTFLKFDEFEEWSLYLWHKSYTPIPKEKELFETLSITLLSMKANYKKIIEALSLEQFKEAEMLFYTKFLPLEKELCQGLDKMKTIASSEFCDLHTTTYKKYQQERQ